MTTSATLSQKEARVTAAITLHQDTSSPCLFKDPVPVSTEISVAKPTVNVAAAVTLHQDTSSQSAVTPKNVLVEEPTNNAAPTLEQKEARFLSAPLFAVVGASSSVTKNGFKALKWLADHHKDVVPVNLKASEILGMKCVTAISALPDPTHTSVSIVVPPKATLEVLKQAKALDIFAVWLQPGAEDDAVADFIEADAQFAERCVYRKHALHSLPAHAVAAMTLHQDTSSPCLFKEPTTVSTEPSVTTLPSATPVVASNVAAGVKHDMISPPSTPPATKSLKLAHDENVNKIGEPIAVSA
ncbi:CoA binding domain-containing protein [Mycena galericulata]|nr:CoA binding domain-containing protein [Mycena galericulata]